MALPADHSIVDLMVSLSNHEVGRVEMSKGTTSSFDKLRMRSTGRAAVAART
jgi:hypothetical protein